MLAGPLGVGDGICLEVCCGTRARARTVHAQGWTRWGSTCPAVSCATRPVASRVVLADAAKLPVRSASVAAAACVLGHTDLPDYPAVLREVARVLRPGGRFVHIGVQLYYIGAFADRTDPARTFRRPICSTR